MKAVLIICLVVFLYLVFRCLYQTQSPSEQTSIEAFDEAPPKIVLFYAYYEKNEEYKQNFKYFLKRGLLKDVKCYIIVNGECSVDIPEWGNVVVLRRENKGYDFAAYAHAISKLEEDYDYYFFMNTSVKGPYYPAAVNPRWVDYFLPLFSKETKLVGTAINIYTSTQHNDYNLERLYSHKGPYTHVQTMFFGMDKELFQYLEEIRFFSEVELELKKLDYLIVFKEIGLSQKVLAKGWNLNCILPEYRGLDYRVLKEDINPTSLNGEMYYQGRYFGKTVQPEQVIFYKGYRVKST
jgi:hypothetical protein